MVYRLDNDQPTLSLRERQILQGAANGETVKVTAGRLGLADLTLDGYMKVVREKLQATTKTHAVAIALRLGLIE